MVTGNGLGRKEVKVTGNGSRPKEVKVTGSGLGPKSVKGGQFCRERNRDADVAPTEH